MHTKTNANTPTRGTHTNTHTHPLLLDHEAECLVENLRMPRHIVVDHVVVPRHSRELLGELRVRAIFQEWTISKRGKVHETMGLFTDACRLLSNASSLLDDT